MSRRRDLSNAAIAALSAGALLAVAAYFAFAYRALPADWRTPGSPPLYWTGLAGTLLLLVPVVFMFAKRTGTGGSPPGWFLAHVVASLVGAMLIAVHTAGSLSRPPALLAATLLLLVVLGVWGRTRGSHFLSATFATRKTAFSPASAQQRAEFESLIRRKQELLARLDPAAREATFSVTLGHWLRSPLLASRYAALARQERWMIGTGGWAPTRQTLARRLHILLAAAFVAGVVVHVVIVTFFADYAARGGPVTWWHLRK